MKWPLTAYTFLPSAHGIFFRIDLRVGHKISHNILKKIKIV